VFRLTLPLRHGERLRTSPLPLLPVAAAPAAAEPGIHDAAPTTGTALPPPEADTGDAGDGDSGTLPEPAPPSGPGTSSVMR
jgi:two-component system, OmpR family, sensor histidine kinase MtrB